MILGLMDVEIVAVELQPSSVERKEGFAREMELRGFRPGNGLTWQSPPDLDSHAAAAELRAAAASSDVVIRAALFEARVHE